MTRDEAYSKYGEAAYSMPSDDFGNVTPIIPYDRSAGGVSLDAFYKANPNTPRVAAKGQAWDQGGPMPIEDFLAWQNGAALNPDGSIQGTTGRVNPNTGMVDYTLHDDAGFFGEFMNFATIPLTFAGMAAGAGGLNSLFSGGGAGIGAGGGLGGGGLVEAGFGMGGAGYGLQTGAQLSQGLNASLAEFLSAGGAGSGFVGDLPIDSGIGGGNFSGGGLGIPEEIAALTGGGGNPIGAEALWDVGSQSFRPEALIEGINPTGPMQGTINSVNPQTRLMFEQGAPQADINALGDVGGTTGSRVAGAMEYAGQYGPSGTNLLGELMSGYKQLKDPLSLLGAFRQWQSSNNMQKMYKDQMARFQQNSFPHGEFVQQARDFFDPAKRYQMLQSNPAFMEAQRYAEQAQRRKNARSGNLNSGYGDSLLANTLAQNANTWDQQMFGQIKDASGMSFNGQNTQAQFSGQALPQMTNLQNQADQGIFEGIRRNQGMLPDIFKTSL